MSVRATSVGVTFWEAGVVERNQSNMRVIDCSKLCMRKHPILLAFLVQLIVGHHLLSLGKAKTMFEPIKFELVPRKIDQKSGSKQLVKDVQLRFIKRSENCRIQTIKHVLDGILIGKELSVLDFPLQSGVLANK